MKKIILLLISIVPSNIIAHAQFDQERNLESIKGINGKDTTKTSKLIYSGFKVINTCYYYAKSKEDSIYKIPVTETIVYRKKSRPKITIAANPNTPNLSTLKKDMVFVKGYTDLETNTEIDSNLFISNGSLVVSNLLNPPTTHYFKEREYKKQRYVRNTFVSTVYQNKTLTNFFLYFNYSPSMSYRRLVAISPTNEYYSYADSAEKTDKASANNKLDKQRLPKSNFNFGIGFGFGSGHSIIAAGSYSTTGYATIKKDTSVSNNGMLLGYRYQRIHMNRFVQPIVELDYGIVSGHRNDIIKASLGLSFALASKNIYLNIAPYYLSRFKASNEFTSNKDIGARLYNYGCDIGLVYKFWHCGN